VIKYQSYNIMNSPQPLSAPQRGAKKDISPSFACKRRGMGDEYMQSKSISKINIIYS
jgi:hypothetical protein